MPQLAETEEERKWPGWLRHLFVIHIATLFWALISVPFAGHTFDIAPIVVLMWLPLFLFAGYYFERPALKLGLYRKLYLIFALIAIFFNVTLALAFIG